MGLEEIPFVVNEEVCRDYILLFTQVEDTPAIIDNAEFIHELTRLYIACADNTTQVGLTFRYMWGVIKLEEWFRYISCGREAVLKKSSTENKDCLMCEVLQHAK